jgi:hypothetical protein
MKQLEKTECEKCKKRMMKGANSLCYECYNNLLDDLQLLKRQSSVISDKRFQEWNEAYGHTTFPMFINGMFNAHPERIKTELKFLTQKYIDLVMDCLARGTSKRRKTRGVSL